MSEAISEAICKIGQPNPEARGLVTQRRGRAVPPSKRENLVYRIRLLLPIVKVSANRGMYISIKADPRRMEVMDSGRGCRK